MEWLYLVGAIILGECGTISFRLGLERPLWFAATVVSYACAWTLLSLALIAGLGIGIGYGTWAASSIALTAILGRVLFRDPLTPTMMLGSLLIMSGVLVISLNGSH
ncbi:hypothetical protein J5277_30540 [Rhizobium sp. 16-449-1b]|uniref:DMT family transporter n=1 Tax=Rhizobium sp. 16-449-1b TaxID=2819989 RepID=UPI001ADB83C9|nr:SMR family transporter [Rhizobium sp. 16-449-1b]MBO9198465.1 hypothetical protein [Rhizobium sp. 16-449-1b]